MHYDNTIVTSPSLPFPSLEAEVQRENVRYMFVYIPSCSACPNTNTTSKPSLFNIWYLDIAPQNKTRGMIASCAERVPTLTRKTSFFVKYHIT